MEEQDLKNIVIGWFHSADYATEQELRNIEGPALFTPLSEDAEIDRLPPWSSRMSSALVPRFAVAYVRSNLWPGAHAYARGRKFENVYIGWGVKSDAAFSPALPPDPQREFPGGPEVTEEADPTYSEHRNHISRIYFMKPEDDPAFLILHPQY
uniref:Uncharacterized protein n=1 Tax=Denticeps clupeoides TaxID=299321 RepID=A0AAY4BJS6_9TELE